jgi:tRNA(fMet)-specific endonuclease VapC
MAEEGAISVITVSELLYGAHRAAPRERPRRFARVEYLLARFAALPISEEVARVHSRVWAELEAAGSIIGGHDLWIAATALANRLAVATLNGRDFARVPGLRVLAL